MQTYSQIALTAAAVMPPLGAIALCLINWRMLKRINERTEEMRQLAAEMRTIKLRINARYGKGTLN